MDKSIIVFCPNPYSFYTISVCELLLRKGYEIDTIVVRKFTSERFFNEIQRDGIRLIKKIWKKLFMRKKAYEANADNIVSFMKNNDITVKNITEFKAKGIDIVYCKNLNDKITEDVLKTKNDKIVVFTGGGIIRKNILELAGGGIINCHMGILPRYRGMDLPEWSILEDNHPQIGMTLHFMDTGIDTGHILKIVKVPLGKSTNIKALRDKFDPVMVTSMVQTVEEYLAGKIQPQAQPPSEKRQYFIVHPKLYERINTKIDKIHAS